MDREERWARAKADTHGLKDWGRGVSSAAFGGAAVFVGLALSDSVKDAVSEIWIVVLAMAGTFALRPLVEFGWNYLWTPWRVLTEDVAAIRSSLDEAEDEEKSERATKTINLRVTLRNLVREGQDILSRSAIQGPWSTAAREAGEWTDSVTRILAKYFPSETAESFLDAADEDSVYQRQLASRIESLKDIAKDAPTSKRVADEDVL